MISIFLTLPSITLSLLHLLSSGSMVKCLGLVLMDGFLSKRGKDSIFRNGTYSQRWMVLTAEPVNSDKKLSTSYSIRLYYYISRAHSDYKGFIDFKTVNGVQIDDQKMGRFFLDSSVRKYDLVAESKEEFLTWLKCIFAITGLSPFHSPRLGPSNHMGRACSLNILEELGHIDNIDVFTGFDYITTMTAVIADCDEHPYVIQPPNIESESDVVTTNAIKHPLVESQTSVNESIVKSHFFSFSDVHIPMDKLSSYIHHHIGNLIHFSDIELITEENLNLPIIGGLLLCVLTCTCSECGDDLRPPSTSQVWSGICAVSYEPNEITEQNLLFRIVDEIRNDVTTCSNEDKDLILKLSHLATEDDEKSNLLLSHTYKLIQFIEKCFECDQVEEWFNLLINHSAFSRRCRGIDGGISDDEVALISDSLSQLSNYGFAVTFNFSMIFDVLQNYNDTLEKCHKMTFDHQSWIEWCRDLQPVTDALDRVFYCADILSSYVIHINDHAFGIPSHNLVVDLINRFMIPAIATVFWSDSKNKILMKEDCISRGGGWLLVKSCVVSETSPSMEEYCLLKVIEKCSKEYHRDFDRFTALIQYALHYGCLDSWFTILLIGHRKQAEVIYEMSSPLLNTQTTRLLIQSMVGITQLSYDYSSTLN